jgi:thiol-disulfide isomerase/thioredoxin
MSEQTRAGEEVDPELRAEYRRQVESFLLRPKFHRETLRGDAYRSLFYLLREDSDADVDPELLYNVVKGMELYEGINLHIIYAMGPVLLADRGVYLDYAETLARKGMVESEKELEEVRGRGIFATEEEFERAANGRKATFLDALGWVLFAQGNLDDAEGTLLEALHASEESPSVFLHLGRLYEKRYARAVEEHPEDGALDFLDQALDFYLKGTLVQAMGENPNEEALETLYAQRHGSMEGFEAFTAGASATDADVRREKILGERLEEPKGMADFAMATLEGDTVRSEDLAGKVVVLNFWGTWCGPCVVEMPGIQEVYDRYKEDAGVVLLTLSNDENLDVLRRFMEKEGYTFPVLLDDGYVDEVAVHAFPTTWFVTPDGMRVFEKRGWSDDLLQEFGWRVEALRGG